jgi:PKD repeat protein
MIRIITFFLFNSIALSVIGQITFHKVYAVNDSLGSFSSIEVLDTGFQIGGSIGRGNRVEAALLYLDLTGTIVNQESFRDSNRNENLSFAYSTVRRKSINENWVHFTSRNLLNGWWYPKIVKFKHDTIITLEVDTLISLFTQYYDGARFELLNTQNKYVVIGNYEYFNSLDTGSTLPRDVGAIMMVFDNNTDSLICFKKYNYSYTLVEKPRRIMKNFLKYTDSTFLMVMNEDLDYPTAYSKLIFYKLDLNGNITTTKTLQDSPYSSTSFGSNFLNNKKDLLICYSNSVLITPTIGQPYWGLTPAVARLDSNFQIIWKKDLGGIKFNSYQLGPKHMINKFSIVGDTAYVAAYFRVYKDENDIAQGNVRIINGNTSDTTINWQRDYNFFSDSSGLLNTVYEIRDIEKTNDGGFILVGEAFNYDSLIIGAPSQLGYILKTNCLGFLGSPETNFLSQNNDSLGVHFTNTSLMAGSYSWDFGDGTTLQTGEFDSAHPPVYHQYYAAGNYEVSLIGYGCNGENDTIRYTITIPEYTPEPTDTVIPANPNIVNYMALGPNPVKSGETIAVYVGKLPGADATLSFHDQAGKLVLKHNISQGNSTNIFVLPFSTGVYHVVLKDNEKVLETEKVVVY